MEEIFTEITNKNAFSLQKTLRFELKPMIFNEEKNQLQPISESDSYLKNFNSGYLEKLKQIIKHDEERAEDYQEIKVYIDELHKQFIDRVLPEIKSLEIDFKKAFEMYELTKKRYAKPSSDKEEEEQSKEKKNNLKAWQDFQKEARKKISNFLKKQPEYENLFEKELFSDLIPKSNYSKQLGEKSPNDLAKSFSGFTTYFQGFHENRKNIYADEGSTSLAHRIINENLPKFFTNILQYVILNKDHNLLVGQFKENYSDEELTELFNPNSFVSFLNQSGVDRYNEIIEAKKGIETAKSKDGLKQLANRYKQAKQIKNLPNFTPLYDQILGKRGLDQNDESILRAGVTDDKNLLNSLKDFNKNIQPSVFELINICSELNKANAEEIFIMGSSLESLSSSVFGDYSVLSRVMKHHYIESRISASRTTEKKLEKDSEAYLKQETYSLQEIQSAIDYYIEKGNELESKSLFDYFTACKYNSNHTLSEEIKIAWDNLQPILELEQIDKDRAIPKTQEEQGGKGFQQVEKIKLFLDSYMQLLHFAKPLHLVKKRNPVTVSKKDEAFYAIFDKNYTNLEAELIPVYNQTRNYLTKKPYSLEKFKINFEKGTLLNGWDLNKEKDNLGVLFLKNNNYYLGIMSNNKIFDFQKQNIKKEALSLSGQQDGYHKVIYKYLAGPNKMLPKVFFAKSNLEKFSASEEILRIRNTSSFTKNGEPQPSYKKAEFNLNDCHAMIDFYKQSLASHEDWSQFGFQFLETSQYSDISQFYEDVAKGGYKISFVNISDNYINEKVKAADLFLFQIYNKDFSEQKKRKDGKPNLHTMYWNAAFRPWLDRSESNVKLNGEAEIFFREHSIERKITHRSGEPIDRKNPKNPGESLFSYDLIKDKRFTSDKFFFHVPITINYKNKKERNNKQFNDVVNSVIKNNRDVNIIGIDRGERNLLYYTVIDQDGRILEQNSFNEISSQCSTSEKSSTFDYHKKLDEKEDERKQARKSWGTIENIKELKSGYLSHVIHKLAKLILKYNAVVCLEDLNAGFKRGRMKIEKQVYQKFELALIHKLNCLVLKDREEGEFGSYTNPYQLSGKITSYQDIFSQTGIVFYVNPAYTSKICPKTGFVNFLDLRYENLEKAKSLIENFNSIRFNNHENYFEFDLDYKKIPQTQNKECGEKTQWTVCTYGNERFIYNPKTRGYDTYNVTEKLAHLFKKHNISYEDGLDLREKILASTQDAVSFFKELLFLLRLTMSLRHVNENHDCILSPIKHPELGFFDSRDVKDSTEAEEPRDADANGAYHIAMKGLQIFAEKISSENPKLSIKKEDWFRFIQNHHETKWKEKSLSPI
jgi:CRISPR-associated protein Cpf1